MDNLQVHKSSRVKELIEGAGASILFLPAYSPDFSPIEQTFSKIKTILRRIEARTREALIEATGVPLEPSADRKMLWVGSGTAATVWSITRYEKCSRKKGTTGVKQRRHP